MGEWSIYQNTHGWALARIDWSREGVAEIPLRRGLDKKGRQMGGRSKWARGDSGSRL